MSKSLGLQKWCGVLAVAVLVAVLLSLAGRPNGRPTRSSVGFVDRTVELGELPWGRDVPVRFQFENRSAAPITIARVSSSCGCTLVRGKKILEGKVVGPGDVVPVEISFNTGARAETKTATITVYTTTGKQYRAGVRATIIGSYNISADTVHFGRVDLNTEDSPPPQVVRFTSVSATLLGDPRADAEWIHCSTRASSSDPRSTDLILAIDVRQLDVGMNIARVEMRTTDPDVPSRNLVVTARGSQELTPYPSHLVLQPGVPQTVRFVDDRLVQAQLAEIKTEGEGVLRIRIIEAGVLEVEVRRPGSGTEVQSILVTDKLGRRGRVRASIFCLAGRRTSAASATTP